MFYWSQWYQSCGHPLAFALAGAVRTDMLERLKEDAKLDCMRKAWDVRGFNVNEKKVIGH